MNNMAVLNSQDLLSVKTFYNYNHQNQYPETTKLIGIYSKFIESAIIFFVFHCFPKLQEK